jgi:H+-transporting ATPase
VAQRRALTARVGGGMIAYDNAPYAPAPVSWDIPKIWSLSAIMGVILAIGTWLLFGTLLAGSGVVQRYGGYQELLFLEIALTENWLIFITRSSMSDFTFCSLLLCYRLHLGH